ncbi:MAG: hypothetical protein JNL01_10020 [Bdellovibrionales bacterium]|nr:hypothetical protein [Bdellovibrionales bacterium]
MICHSCEKDFDVGDRPHPTESGLCRACQKSYRPKLGEDFYLEGDFTVFTAAYHLKRGYCCGSGCRHCPYNGAKRGT